MLEAENQQAGESMKCSNCGGMIVALPIGLSYICPNCSQKCSVAEAFIGQNVACPFCANEFLAASPEVDSGGAEPPHLTVGQRPDLTIPEKLPLFKSGRQKLFQQKCGAMLVREGIDAAAAAELVRFATAIGLDAGEAGKTISDLQSKGFLEEFNPIKARVEKAYMVTDDDLEEIEHL